MFRAQSTTTYPIGFFMVLASDHVTPATGLTPVVTISKNGAGFGAASGAVSEIGNGWYSLAGNATDRATLGELLIHAAVATADNTDLKVLIVTNDMFAALATPTNITGGTITTVTNLTNAPTNGDLTATMKTSVTTAATAATPTAAEVTGAVGSVTGLTASDVGAIKTTIGVAGAGLTALGDTRIANLDAPISGIPTATVNADALLNRDMSAVSDTNARSPLNALRFLRNKWTVVGTALTVTKEDDTTSAWTATVTATAGADPITGNDPA